MGVEVMLTGLKKQCIVRNADTQHLGVSEAGNSSLLGGENVKRLIDFALTIVLSAELRGTGCGVVER